MAIQWLLGGHPVYVVSTCKWSRAASIMMYHLLLKTVNTQMSAGVSHGQPYLLQYDLDDGEDVEKAVNDLSQEASGGSLYVIADEAGPDWMLRHFKTFCDKLLRQVSGLHLWAASCFFRDATSDDWQVEYLTRPLRSPPAVVKEVEKDRYIAEHHEVMKYKERGVPDHTDGPPVIRLYHLGQSHAGRRPLDCVTCGREVASFLHSLRVGATENITTTSRLDCTTPPCLQWRNVVVLCVVNVSENSGTVKGLKEAGIPVRVMKDEDIEDVATARSDVVWVTRGHYVRGLERKVVVCLVDVDVNADVRLHFMSRCTSQLVIVSPYN
ncbi:uncharacterized protein LOC112559807 [Pomacea canaliculata]|uniref:uncharacterized protein LOC112559807 n=1 Tax=Pomacea canaliculata TaxID=400727 RepID=UPI000D72A61B|nr:uncharacterized protein LOC112559807 [Pomacea canaliculata]